MQLTADHYEEVTISLTGSLERAEPDVGIMSDGTVDHDIEAIYITRKVWQDGKRVDRQFNILAGLNQAAITAIVQNVLDALGDDQVNESLMEAAE